MAQFDSIGWFPIRIMYLRDDLPTPSDLDYEKAIGYPLQRRVIAIVAQHPESATSWPYTFERCHPAKAWRRPDNDEMARALVFYGLLTAPSAGMVDG